jgi:hydroxymethylpyrimidine pyrophosphatase-like HAD family hydrolase
MENKRWTQKNEMQLVHDLKDGETIENLASKYNREVGAVELRLKQIIYENVMKGKTIEKIATALNLSPEKVRSYFNSYKEFYERNQSLIENIETKNSPIPINSDETLKNFVEELEYENKVMKLIIDNKKLSEEIDRLIEKKKIKSAVKTIIEQLKKEKFGN